MNLPRLPFRHIGLKNGEIIGEMSKKFKGFYHYLPKDKALGCGAWGLRPYREPRRGDGRHTPPSRSALGSSPAPTFPVPSSLLGERAIAE